MIMGTLSGAMDMKKARFGRAFPVDVRECL
jgi:hypothetical protein